MGRLVSCGALLLTLGISGCVSGSLASSTGPRKGKSVWSVATRQRAHVGETVRFDFVLTAGPGGAMVDPVGVADYCIVFIGAYRMIMDPDPMGHFRFEHTFETLVPKTSVKVQATAYRVRGYRDYMKIAGEWVESASPIDMPDLIVAADTISLAAYRLDIQLDVESPGVELDRESGKLRIGLDTGSEIVRYIARPHRPGFTIQGPSVRGTHTVHYETKGNEINTTGKTRVAFEIYDLNGKRIVVTRVFDTP